MPSVETGEEGVFVLRDGGGVEGPVVRVAKLDVGQAFVGRDEAVADDLDLRLVGDGLEVRVEDGAFGVEGLAVAVGGGGGWVEALGDGVLGFGGDVPLVPDEDHLVPEEGVTDHFEIGICGEKGQSRLCSWDAADGKGLPEEVTDFTGILPTNNGQKCHGIISYLRGFRRQHQTRQHQSRCLSQQELEVVGL